MFWMAVARVFKHNSFFESLEKEESERPEENEVEEEEWWEEENLKFLSSKSFVPPIELLHLT